MCNVITPKDGTVKASFRSDQVRDRTHDLPLGHGAVARLASDTDTYLSRNHPTDIKQAPWMDRLKPSIGARQMGSRSDLESEQLRRCAPLGEITKKY